MIMDFRELFELFGGTKLEQVLVVKKSLLFPFLGNKFNETENAIWDLINRSYEYLPREMAELDDNYKQIIPYTVICHNDMVFLTRRLNTGGEPRLYDLYSIGIGGHINPCDTGDPILQGLKREIAEEIQYEKLSDPRFIGIINDDTNDVGRVHLGLFFIIDSYGEVSVREKDKLMGQWVGLNDLEKYLPHMENWSYIACGFLLGR